MTCVRRLSSVDGEYSTSVDRSLFVVKPRLGCHDSQLRVNAELLHTLISIISIAFFCLSVATSSSQA